MCVALPCISYNLSIPTCSYPCSKKGAQYPGLINGNKVPVHRSCPIIPFAPVFLVLGELPAFMSPCFRKCKKQPEEGMHTPCGI